MPTKALCMPGSSLATRPLYTSPTWLLFIVRSRNSSQSWPFSSRAMRVSRGVELTTRDLRTSMEPTFQNVAEGRRAPTAGPRAVPGRRVGLFYHVLRMPRQHRKVPPSNIYSLDGKNMDTVEKFKEGDQPGLKDALPLISVMTVIKQGPDERRVGPPEAASGGAGSHPGVPSPRFQRARRRHPWVEPMLGHERPNHCNHRNQWQKAFPEP